MGGGGVGGTLAWQASALKHPEKTEHSMNGRAPRVHMKHETVSARHQARTEPKPGSLNPEPGTIHPANSTPNPKP